MLWDCRLRVDPCRLDINTEGGFSVNTVIEVGWFIAYIVALNYSIKHLGAGKTLSWLFSVSSLVCLSIVFPYMLRIIHPHDGSLTLRSLLVPGVLSALATIYGVAWWTVWKRKPSARVWPIAASLTFILVPLFTIWSKLHFSRSIRDCSVVMLATGVISLVALFRRQYDPSRNRTAS